MWAGGWAVVTYDIGRRRVGRFVGNKAQKVRQRETAAPAVAERRCARPLPQGREGDVRGAIATAAQARQWRSSMACVDELLPLMRPGRDWFALGGFCHYRQSTGPKAALYEYLTPA